MANNRVPKQIIDKNGKQNTVYVSVDSTGSLSLRRLQGLNEKAPSRLVADPTPEELTNGTFDPKPWITAGGTRTADPVTDGRDNYFSPQEAFALSWKPIDPSAQVYFPNPYARPNENLNEPHLASVKHIQLSTPGTEVSTDFGGWYIKNRDGSWRSKDSSSLGESAVPEHYLINKINSGEKVFVYPVAISYEHANQFEFDGRTVNHYYADANTVRIEVDVDGGEAVTHWHTDGTNDILQGRKATLADLTVALVKSVNGEDPNGDLYEHLQH